MLQYAEDDIVDEVFLRDIRGMRIINERHETSGVGSVKGGVSLVCIRCPGIRQNHPSGETVAELSNSSFSFRRAGEFRRARMDLSSREHYHITSPKYIEAAPLP